MKAEPVSAPGAMLGEGPVWDAAANTLWWVDILGKRLHGHRPEPVQFEVPHMPSLAVPRGDGTLTLVTEAGLVAFDPATGIFGPPFAVEKGRPGNRSNDSKISPGGTLVMGTMGRQAEAAAGGFYSVSPEGQVACLLPGVSIPNGLAWSPDGSLLHFHDSAYGMVLQADWNEAERTIGPPRPFYKIEGAAAPDGAAMDRDGTYWLALWDGGRVVGIAPDGRQVAEIKLPVARPTACAFGGPTMQTLFITSAADGDVSPLAGALFARQMDVPGMAIPPFRWSPR